MIKQFSQYTKADVEIKSINTLYHGFFKIEEYQLTHKLFDGYSSNLLSREIFERGDAVVVMPYDPIRDSLVFIEQFRAGALRTCESPWLLEFIAGMFGKNEEPIDVAIREAKEEANLVITENDLIPITHYLSSPGGMSESIHLFAAKVDASVVGGVYGLDEEGEDIKVHEISRVDAIQMVKDGTINNASTIIGVQWLALNYQELT